MGNPYRIFFPLAWLMALWGGGVWLMFGAGLVGYPALVHPQSMIGGFLVGHVAGFLLTAGPRFTGTELLLSRLELTVSLGPYLLLCFAALAGERQLFFFALTCLLLGLIAILGGRFIRRSKLPPPQFVFLPMGLLAALLGAVLGIFGIGVEITRLVVFEAFVLSLVLGVGSRLVPFMLGHSAQQPDAPGKEALTSVHLLRRVLIYLSLFWLSYILEILWSDGVALARLFRGTIVLSLMILEWKIAKRPRSTTKQAFALWLSAWMIGLGLVLSSYVPWRLHALHIFYIGGLGLLTLMIATRVLLAHGSQRLLLEQTSPVLIPIGVALFFAAIARSLGGMWPAAQLLWIYGPAVVWVVSVFAWGVVFLREGLREGQRGN